MTAEIAIMNKSAIALASDSAVTIITRGGHKVYNTVNKLFRLSKHYPVGVMLYGQASFLGVPWETIIKEYRAHLGVKNFDFLEDFSADFIRFLGDKNPLFPESEQEKYIERMTRIYFEIINKEIAAKVKEALGQKKSIGPGKIKKIASGIITEHYVRLEGVEWLPTIPVGHVRNVKKKYDGVIQKAKDDAFQQLPIYKKDETTLRKIAGFLFSKHFFPESISGIVVAGFGTKDAFPKLQSYTLETIVNHQLKYVETHNIVIDFENTAFVVPFAQSEMVCAFMEGIDPNLDKAQEEYLHKIFEKYPEVIIKAVKGLTASDQQKIMKN